MALLDAKCRMTIFKRGRFFKLGILVEHDFVTLIVAFGPVRYLAKLTKYHANQRSRQWPSWLHLFQLVQMVGVRIEVKVRFSYTDFQG